MVKIQQNLNNSHSNIINNVSLENKAPKSRQQIYQENYQKNKEKKKARQKERYAQQKEQTKKQLDKYYQANSIKVLLSFKEYTELNQETQKKWLDFAWTLQDCQDENGIKIHDIVQIQKLKQLADNLIRDYYKVAKKSSKSSWNTLTEEEQNKLIKYWGRKKARKEQELGKVLEEQEIQGETYEKEIEKELSAKQLAKFHEERGKLNCGCYSCAESQKIQGEIKKKVFNESEKQKEQCSECKKWVKKLDEETEVCKSCQRKYE